MPSYFDLDALDSKGNAGVFDLDALDAGVQQSSPRLWPTGPTIGDIGSGLGHFKDVALDVAAVPGKVIRFGAGAAGKGIGSLEESLLEWRAKQKGIEGDPRTQEALAAARRLKDAGQALMDGAPAGKTLVAAGKESGLLPKPGDDLTLGEKAVGVVMPPIGAAMALGGKEHVRGIREAGLEQAIDFGTDPLTYAGLGALKAIGVVGKPLTAAAGLLFAYEAGKQVPEHVAAAIEDAKKQGHWTPEATKELALAASMGGMAVLGGKHALGEAAALAPKRGGLAYEHDPLATSGQLKLLDATNEAMAEQQNRAGRESLAARDLAAQKVAQDPLGLAAEQPAPERPPSPDVEAYRAERAAQDLADLSQPDAQRGPDRPAPDPQQQGPWNEALRQDAQVESGVRVVRDPALARELAVEGKPVADLMAMRDRLRAKLQNGSMTQQEAQAYLQIDKALSGRLGEQAARLRPGTSNVPDPVRVNQPEQAQPAIAPEPRELGNLDFLPETARKPVWDAIKKRAAEYEAALRDKNSDQLGGVDDIQAIADQFAQRVPERFRAGVSDQVRRAIIGREKGWDFRDQIQQYRDEKIAQGRKPWKVWRDPKTGAAVEIWTADGNPGEAIYSTVDGAGEVAAGATSIKMKGGKSEIGSVVGGSDLMGLPDYAEGSGAGPIYRALKDHGVESSKKVTDAGRKAQRKAARAGLDVTGAADDIVSTGGRNVRGQGAAPKAFGEVPGQEQAQRAPGSRAAGVREPGEAVRPGSGFSESDAAGLSDALATGGRQAAPGPRLAPGSTKGWRAGADVRAKLGLPEETAIPAERTPEGYARLAREAAARREAQAAADGGEAKPKPITVWNPKTKRFDPVGTRGQRDVQERVRELWQQEKPPEQPPLDAGSAKAIDQGSTLLRRIAGWIEPAYSALERIPGVGQQLAGRARAYVWDWEVGGGKFTADTFRALEKLSGKPVRSVADAKNLNATPEARQLIQFLDQKSLLKHGVIEKPIPIESLPENVRAAAEEMLALRARQRAGMKETGLIDDSFDETNLTHLPKDPKRFSLEERAKAMADREQISYEDALSKLREPGDILVGGTRTGRRAVAEHRISTGAAELKPGEYRDDIGAWLESGLEVERRVAEAKHLGKDGELAQALVRRMGDRDHKFAQTFLDRVRNTEAQGFGHQASSLVRSTQSALGLVRAPLRQFTTAANTAAEGGVAGLVKGGLDVFWRDVKGPDGKPYRWTQPIKRMRDSMHEARLEASERGSLMAGTAEPIVDAFTESRAQGGTGKVASWYTDLIKRLPWLKGVGHQDTLQRVWADQAAKHVIPKAWERAKAGDNVAQRDLVRWGIDWRKPELTPEMIDRGRKLFTDRSQFKVGIGELPLWASSPWGKVAFQFQSFGYAHTKLMGHAFAEAAKGNVGPIARLLTIGSALGYASNRTMNLIFKGRAPENPDEKDFKEAARDAFSKGVHYDPSGPDGLALAAIEGLGAYGGSGILGAAVERAGSGNAAEIAFGVTGKDASTLAELGKAVAAGKPVTRPLARVASGFAPSLPLGADPKDWIRELTSDKPLANPTYAGQILDALGAGPGAEARSMQHQLDVASRNASKSRSAYEELLAPNEKKPLDERLEAAKKRDLGEALRLELILAVRANDMDAARRVMDKAAAAGINLYGRSGRKLESRAKMRMQMEEAAQ